MRQWEETLVCFTFVNMCQTGEKAKPPSAQETNFHNDMGCLQTLMDKNV